MRSDVLRVTGLLCASLALLGCPPNPKSVCEKLHSMRSPADTRSEGDFKADCSRKLDALKDRSKGEYGACSQCVMNAVSQERLAECREHCAGLEDMLPAASSPPAQ
jgi:hypothetical protein